MSHLFRNALTALASTLAFLPAPALAASIFVNGTQVDGALSDYKLEKCTANFDKQGDLHLDCPGYNFKVETEEGMAQAPATATPLHPQQAAVKPKLSRQYVLFSSQSTIGATGFDVDVFINGVLAVRLKNEDVQVVEDVTPHLRKGENTVTFVARKKQLVRPVKADPGDYHEVQIAEGAVDPATDTLQVKQNSGIRYRVTAAETLDSTKEMKLTAQ